MALPEPKPIMEHLDWPDDELAAAADAVEAMLVTDGWKALVRAIEDRLRFEQRVLMSQPVRVEDEQIAYERKIGTWAGMRRVQTIAEGIVERGKTAEREMRGAA